MEKYKPTFWEYLRGISLRNKAVLFRNMANQASAGVQIDVLACFGSKRSGITHKQDMVFDMAKHIEEGMPLSEVLARYPFAFSSYEAAMVRAGEVGGTLDVQLQALADGTETKHALRGEVVSASAYPALVLCMAVVLLPVPMLLNDAQNYMLLVSSIFAVLAMVLGSVYSIYRFGNVIPSLRRFLDYVASWIPGLGQVVKSLASFNYLQCLSRLYASGLMVDRCAEVACSASGNMLAEERLSDVAAGLREGTKLSVMLDKSKQFPPFVISILMSGEEAGRLPDCLAKSGDYLFEEAKASIKRMSIILPAIAMLLVGGAIGFYVVKMYTDMLDSNLNF